MADEVIPAVQPAPAPEAPAAQPAPNAPSTPEPVTAPTQPALPLEQPKVGVAPDAPVVDATKQPESKSQVKSLLATDVEADKAPSDADAKPGEQPEVKVDDQSDKPASLPTFQWELPEALKSDDPAVKAALAPVEELLGKFEQEAVKDGKIDHTMVEKLGNQLLSQHAAVIKEATEKAIQASNDQNIGYFEKMKEKYAEDFKADPDIGGAKWKETLTEAQRFIRSHGGTDAQQAEFMDLMDETGLGSHKAMLRILAQASKNMREGTAMAARAAIPMAKGKFQKFYGSKKAG